jgi:hypothetical protein
LKIVRARRPGFSQDKKPTAILHVVYDGTDFFLCVRLTGSRPHDKDGSTGIEHKRKGNRDIGLGNEKARIAQRDTKLGVSKKAGIERHPELLPAVVKHNDIGCGKTLNSLLSPTRRQE